MPTIRIKEAEGFVEAYDPGNRAPDLDLPDWMFDVWWSDGSRWEPCHVRVTVPTLASAEDEEDLKWYIEDYLLEDPFESSRSSAVVGMLGRYAERLVQALKVQAILPQEELVSDIEFQIEDSGSGRRAIHGIHWEILEEINFWPQPHPRSVSVIRLVESIREAIATSPLSAAPERDIDVFNILIISARLPTSDEVPYRLVSRQLIEVMATSGSCGRRCNLEVVRPGTFAAFKHYLELPGRGYFDLVHFDLHGLEDEAGRVSLAFLRKQGGIIPYHLVSAEDVVKELLRQDIDLVVLNACNSASHTRPESNIAKIFIAEGLKMVVAMSFKAISSSVESFMRAFYFSFLAEKLPLEEATRSARNSLRLSPDRLTRFGTTVELSDFLVPVIYKRASLSRVPMGNVLPHARQIESTPEESLFDLQGRENDILLLESNVLLKCNVGLIEGSVGVGKTALAHHLSKWWTKTGLIEATLVYEFGNVDLGRATSIDGMAKALYYKILQTPSSSPLEDMVKFLNRRRYLVVLDNFESSGINTIQDKKKFKNFLRGLRHGTSLILILSRKRESWLEVVIGQPHALDGLQLLPAVLHIVQVLKNENFTVNLNDNITREYLERLVQLADGNPLVLQLFAHDLQIRATTPKAYFQHIVEGGCVMLDNVWISQNVKPSPRSVSELQNLVQNLEKSDIGFMAAALAPFWRLFPSDDLPAFFVLLFFEIGRISGDAPLLDPIFPSVMSPLDFTEGQLTPARHSRDYIFDNFSKAYVLSPLTPKTQKSFTKHYHIIHPLLSIVLRSHLSKCQEKDFVMATPVAFVLFYNYCVKKWPFEEMTDPKQVDINNRIVKLDLINFLSASNILLLLPLEPPFSGAYGVQLTVVLMSLVNVLSREADEITIYVDLLHRALCLFLVRLALSESDPDGNTYEWEVSAEKALFQRFGASTLQQNTGALSKRFCKQLVEVQILYPATLYAFYLSKYYRTVGSELEQTSATIFMNLQKRGIDVSAIPAPMATGWSDMVNHLFDYSAVLTSRYNFDALEKLVKRGRLIKETAYRAQGAPSTLEHEKNLLDPTPELELQLRFNKMMLHRQYDDARRTILSALDAETNHGANDPARKARYHDLLSSVAYAMANDQTAIDHLKLSIQIHKTLPGTIPESRHIEWEGRLAQMHEKLSHTTMVYDYIKGLLARANRSHDDPVIEVQTMVVIARLRTVQHGECPVAAMALLIRSAKAFYRHENARSETKSDSIAALGEKLLNNPETGALFPESHFYSIGMPGSVLPGYFVREILRLGKRLRLSGGNAQKSSRAATLQALWQFFSTKIDPLVEKLLKKADIRGRSRIYEQIESKLFNNQHVDAPKSSFKSKNWDSERALYEHLDSCGITMNQCANRMTVSKDQCFIDEWTCSGYVVSTCALLGLAGYIPQWNS